MWNILCSFNRRSTHVTRHAGPPRRVEHLCAFHRKSTHVTHHAGPPRRVEHFVRFSPEVRPCNAPRGTASHSPCLRTIRDLLVLFRSRRSQHYTPEEEPKSCCGVVVTQTVSIRWFIVMIAFVGICCAVVGTVLGAMKASGREHLTVSLLMIGSPEPHLWTEQSYVKTNGASLVVGNIIHRLTIGALRPLALSSASLKSILWDGGRKGERHGVASQPTKVSFRTNKNRWITETVDGASYQTGLAEKP
uniref:Uncharacterized protein n=1 Tax=Timema monikensis TaxID=170555 RepID=A0A7R9E9T5_9NEOP|nr:unnamed protein product [Timema monikensis]